MWRDAAPPRKWGVWGGAGAIIFSDSGRLRFWIRDECPISFFQNTTSLGSRSRQTNPRSLDLMVFWPWFWKATKSFPEVLTEGLSGLASRSRQNRSQKTRYDDSLAWLTQILGLEPSRDLEIMIFILYLSLLYFFGMVLYFY